MTVVLLHGRLSVAAAMFAFAMGAWAVWLALRGRSVDGGYLGAIAIGEALLLVQGGLGVILLVGEGAAPGRTIHLLYGIMALLVWPFAYPFAQPSDGRRGSIIYAASSLFLWGLALRAITTSGAVQGG